VDVHEVIWRVIAPTDLKLADRVDALLRSYEPAPKKRRERVNAPAVKKDGDKPG
jgi:hypothetical protein